MPRVEGVGSDTSLAEEDVEDDMGQQGPLWVIKWGMTRNLSILAYSGNRRGNNCFNCGH